MNDDVAQEVHWDLHHSVVRLPCRHLGELLDQRDFNLLALGVFRYRSGLFSALPEPEPVYHFRTAFRFAMALRLAFCATVRLRFSGIFTVPTTCLTGTMIVSGLRG